VREDALEDSTADQIYKTLFTGWFLQPKSKTTSAMSIGSSNEKNVMENLASFIDKYSQGKFQIQELSTHGIMVPERSEYIGTSVDALVRFGSRDVVPVEIKTRVADTSLQALELLIDRFGRFMVCCHVNAQNSSTFSEVIPIKSDRCQILHHAVVIGVSTVLYVEATTHEIQRCVLVSFSDELISEYKEVMNYIYDNYMHWIYRKNEVVPTFDTEILGNCTDMHTLHQTLSVWHAAVRCYEESGSVPFPAIRSISPASVCTSVIPF
jgi:hypothetical protein